MNPFADMGQCLIDALGAHEIITVRSAGVATLGSDGYMTTGADVLTVYNAVVNPMPPDKMLALPQGERTEGGIEIFTISRIKRSNPDSKDVADVVEWQGDRWKIISEDHWSAQAGFYYYLAVREGEG